MAVIDLTQFLDRGIDYAIYADAFTNDTPVQSMLVGGGQLLTGVAKVAQRFAMDLLEDNDASPYFTEQGSGFIRAFRQGRLRVESDVVLAFNFAAAEILQRMTEAEKPEDPDDERLVTADLTGITLSPGDVTLAIELVTRSGDSRTLILPTRVVF